MNKDTFADGWEKLLGNFGIKFDDTSKYNFLFSMLQGWPDEKFTWSIQRILETERYFPMLKVFIEKGEGWRPTNNFQSTAGIIEKRKSCDIRHDTKFGYFGCFNESGGWVFFRLPDGKTSAALCSVCFGNDKLAASKRKTILVNPKDINPVTGILKGLIKNNSNERPNSNQNLLEEKVSQEGITPIGESLAKYKVGG